MYKGLVAAVLTPMNEDGSVNLDVVEGYAEHLNNSSVKNVFACGSTGEALCLTVDERKALAQRWIDVAGKDMNVIIQVGHCCLNSSLDLCRHARKIGADSIAFMCPKKMDIKNTEDLANYCALIAKDCGDKKFYYYHTPHDNDLNFKMMEFLEVVDSKIPNFAGIKFTSYDLFDYSRCLGYKQGKYEVLYGRDELLLCALILGGIAAIGSTYSFMGSLYNTVIENYYAGSIDIAREFQLKANRLSAKMAESGLSWIALCKAIMVSMGVNCGIVRAPGKNITQNDKRVLDEVLQVFEEQTL